MPGKARHTVTRRSRRRRKPRLNTRLTLGGFPSQMKVKLRYVDTNLTLDASAGSFTSFVFRANSLFDPDFTGLGHQPMKYDEWSLIYHRYTVLAAKITVTYTPSVQGAVVPSYIGITLSGDSDPLSNYSNVYNILESNLSSGYRVVGSTIAQAPPEQKISKSFNAKKFFGVKDVVDGSAHTALVTTNPAKDAYFSVWQASVDGNDPGTISCTVVIDYTAIFREPKNVDGS